MSDCRSNSDLESFVVGALQLEQQDAIGLHVSECEACQRQLEKVIAGPDSADPAVPKGCSSEDARDMWNNVIAERVTRRLQLDVVSGGDAEFESPPEISGCEIHGE